MEKTIKKAVVYIRVSTSDQANSVAAQTDRLIAYCKYNNIEIVKILEDQDVSGGTELLNRVSGSEIKTLIQNKEINCVVATKLDRLFRSTINALLMVDMFDKKNIALHLADMSGITLDTSSANGRFFFTMLASSSQYEKDRVSERVKEVSNHKKKNMKVYAAPPLGYTVQNRVIGDDGSIISGGELVEDAEEMKTVKTIFVLHKQGMPMNRISNRLNAEKRNTKNNKKFYANTVRHILNNTIYNNISK